MHLYAASHLYLLAVSAVGCNIVVKNRINVFLWWNCFVLLLIIQNYICSWMHCSYECWNVFFFGSFLQQISLFSALFYNNMIKHAWRWGPCPRLQSQKNSKQLLREHTLLPSLTWSRNYTHSVFWFSAQLHNFVSHFNCILVSYLVSFLPHSEPPVSFSIFRLSVSLWPFSFSLGHLWLVLVVTIFIFSILERLRRNNIHLFMGGVKKSLCCCEVFNKALVCQSTKV